MKKWIICIMVLCMVVLAGCGAPQSGENNETQNPNTSNSGNDVSQDGVTGGDGQTGTIDGSGNVDEIWELMN